MARRSGPTLYEVMSKSSTGPAPRPSSGRRTAGPDADRPATPVLFTPGSVVRLPVGHVWVLIVAAVAVALAAYFVGRNRGAESARVELAEQIARADRVAAETSRIREPGSASNRPDEGPAASTGSGSVAGRVPPPPASLPRGGDADGQLPSVLDDRRTSGKSYYQLITTRHDDAVATALVVREVVGDLGLDAQVVRGDNPGLSSVILLPGFDRRTMSEDERRNWDERMRLLRSRVAGRLRFSGEQPFSDAFPVLHQP